MKYGAKMFYCYLTIIVINLILNIIFLALGVSDLDTLNSSILSTNSSIEIDNDKIILKISQDKVNLDLVQIQEEGETKAIESNNKIDLPYGNKEDECKVKTPNSSFLNDIHKRILSVDKSYFPSHFQKNCLPKFSEDVPVYGNKLVTFKPSSLLQDRNLPEMSIEIPKSTNMGKLTELHKAIDGADKAVKLYDSQFIKFNKVLSDIKNGTEEFYPNEAKPLMESYVDLVTKLSHQQKVMANEAINQLHKLDSNFSRDLYPIDNSGGVPSTGRVPGAVTGIDVVPRTGIVTGTDTNTGGSGAKF
jgi:hypothetical protein